MDAIARNLNGIIEGTVVERALSAYGRRAFFPEGIVAQSQEAARAARTANATAGVAIERSHHMTHRLFEKFSSVLDVDSMVAYAPTAGDIRLRHAWWNEMVRKNPALEDAHCSLPVVTSGLTHALSIVADLFLDPEDRVIVPTPCWDNYEQIFSVRKGCDLIKPSLFDEQRKFSIKALVEAMTCIESDKIVVLLNFPNNPTGYTPTEGEMAELAGSLVKKANEGKTVVVIIDDAYFGLFHERDAFGSSIFSLLHAAHENLLAIKCDAATKEAMVWGFRIGFVTYGSHNLSDSHFDVLVQKSMGAIRSSVSSGSRIGQSLLLAAMENPSYQDETMHVSQEMAKRYAIVKQEIGKRREHPLLQPFPFNSGYFCTLACAFDAEQLRKYLLEHHQIGTVSLGPGMLRIAYSAVDEQKLPDLIDMVYRSAETLWM